MSVDDDLQTIAHYDRIMAKNYRYDDHTRWVAEVNRETVRAAQAIYRLSRGKCPGRHPLEGPRGAVRETHPLNAFARRAAAGLLGEGLPGWIAPARGSRTTPRGVSQNLSADVRSLLVAVCYATELTDTLRATARALLTVMGG